MPVGRLDGVVADVVLAFVTLVVVLGALVTAFGFLVVVGF